MADVHTEQATYANAEEAVRALDRMEAARNPESDQPEGDEDDSDEQVADGDETLEQDEPTEDVEGDEDDAPKSAIKFAGQEYAVPEGTPPELAKAVEKLGQNLEADYTRQTQVLAETRKAAEYTVRKNVEHATEMQGQAQIVMKFLGDLIGQEPDPSLIHSDPQEYLMRKEIRAKRMEEYQYLNQYVQSLSTERERAEQQQMQLMLQEEMPKLVKAIPEVATEKGYKALQAKIFQVGEKYGFTKQEIASSPDSRVILALRDLAEFQKFKAAKQGLQTKNIPPRTLKPAAIPQNSQRSKTKDATREFLKSARTDRDLRRWAERTS